MIKKAVLFVLALVFAASSMAAVCAAQEKEKQTIVKKEKGPTVFGTIIVYGTVPRPQTAIVLMRARAAVESKSIEVDYSDKIIDSVNDEVF